MVDEHGENLIVVAPGANAHLTLDSPMSGRSSPTATSCCCSWRSRSRPRSPRPAKRVRRARRSSSTPPRSARTRPVRAGCGDRRASSSTRPRPRSGPGPYATSWSPAARRGASYRGPGGPMDIPSPEVTPIDTTGAGDVFAGVLAADGRRPRVALRRACAPERWRHWCPAPAIAHRLPTPSTMP